MRNINLKAENCTFDYKNSNIMDAIKYVLSEEIETPQWSEDYIELLEKCFNKMFYFYFVATVRKEQDVLQKSYKKIIKPKCELCGCNCNKLEMHHKIPVCSYGGNERSNLMFLCKDCHKKMTIQQLSLRYKGDKG